MNLSYQKRAEIDICHAYLNALGAATEGRYHMLHMLDKLASPGSHAGDLNMITKLRRRVRAWEDRMWIGDPLIFSDDPDEWSGEVIEVIDLVNEVKDQCLARATVIDSMYARGTEYGLCLEAMYLLSGFLAYQAYSRDYYIRGLVRYGEVFGPNEVAENWRKHLISCEDGIVTAHDFYEELLEAESADDDLVYQLTESTLLLPSIFRCQAHDINQVHGILQGDFSYRLAEFSPEEAAEWDSCGFSPRAAGYWRAYDVEPAEVLQWLEFGFYQPGLVGAWRYRGFQPDEAVRWLDSGYTARQAHFYASFGCETPAEARHMIEYGH